MPLVSRRGTSPRQLSARGRGREGPGAYVRVPPHAAWMRAMGRLPVCMRATSRAVMKQTAEKFARNVFGSGDLPHDKTG